MNFGAQELIIEVRTFKAGMLSKVAHDLLIRSTKHELSLDGARVMASVDLEALEVVDAQKNGQPDPGALTHKDKSKIEDTMRNDVLHTKRFPRATFDGSIESGTIAGDLTLHGKTRRISFKPAHDGTAFMGELPLLTPDFGIPPFKALMGALKLEPEIRLTIKLEASPDLLKASE